MTLERRQPLPVGRYWLDLRPGTLDTFRNWAAANLQRVQIERFEAHGGVTFTIFQIVKPITFDQRTFGFPTIATPDVQHAADTATRPPVPKPLDALNELLNAVHLPSLDGLGAMVLLAGAYLLMMDK